jgi:hypothetical protein
MNITESQIAATRRGWHKHVIVTVAVAAAIIGIVLPATFTLNRTKAEVSSAASGRALGAVSVTGDVSRTPSDRRSVPSYFGFLEFDWDAPGGIPGFDP